jgi:hypothetical protein
MCTNILNSPWKGFYFSLQIGQEMFPPHVTLKQMTFTPRWNSSYFVSKYMDPLFLKGIPTSFKNLDRYLS